MMGEATKTKTSRRTVTGLRISDDLTLPLGAVTEVISVLATRGAGKSFGSADFAEELYAAGLQFVVIDPMGVYWGLRSSYDGESEGLRIFVLGGDRGDVPLEPTSGRLIADVVVDSGQSFVLDLSLFDSKADQVRFMEAFCERLFFRKGPLESRTPIMVIVDEADEFAPQKPETNETKMLGHMIRLAKRGRTRGIGLLNLTQRSAEFAKSILDLSSAVVFMRTAGPRDRKAIKDWLKGSAPELLDLVDARFPKLETGEALVYSPHWLRLEEPADVRFRMIETFDSYRTPEPGEARLAPAAAAAIDLARLGEQIAATVERAKENDPAELRKRLREAQALEGRVAELEDEVERRAVGSSAYEPYWDTYFRELGWTHPEETPESVPVYEIDDAVARLKNAGEALTAGLDRLRALAEAAETRPAAPARLRETTQRETPAPASPTAAPGPRPGPRAVPERDASGGASTNGLPTGARHLLATLADNHPLRLTVGQLAMLARRKPRGGAWNTAMKTLREGGYVVEEGAEIVLTAHGVEATGAASYLTATQMVERWRAALPAAALDIFDLLVEAHPNPVTIDDIAGRTGRAARGGSWNSAVATLVRNGLAEKTTDGLVATERAMGD